MENVHPLFAPHLQHGGFEEWDVVRVCGEMKMTPHFILSDQQLCGLRNLGPAVFFGVLFCGIDWMDPTESICSLELIEVILINRKEGSIEELAESAVQRVMLRRALT